MFTDGAVALLFTVGISAWVYARVQRSTGSANPKQSLIVTAFVGVIIFIVIFSLLKLIPRSH